VNSSRSFYAEEVGINGSYRYSKVSIYAKQSGTADNFVSNSIRDGVFCIENKNIWGTIHGQNDKKRADYRITSITIFSTVKP